MLNLTRPIYVPALFLVASLSAPVIWVLSKNEPGLDVPTSRVGVAETESVVGLVETELPVAIVEEPERRIETPHTEPPAPPDFGTRRHSDGDIRVIQDGPIRVTAIAENCGMRHSGWWSCDWRMEVFNPYEQLEEDELRGLADFDPYAGLMLAEVARQQGATESELFDILIRVVALLPDEDKGKGWAHMMDTLGKSAFGATDGSDAAILEGYAWLLASIELGILSTDAPVRVEQELERRGLNVEAGKEHATRIASEARSAFLESGRNPQ